MTLKEALKKYHSIETELLLTHLLGKPKEFLYAHPEYELSKAEESKLARMVMRRLKSEPVAYIVGFKDFYGLRFKVNKHTLIPRPETEWIVEQVVQKVKSQKSKVKSEYRILDVGTGSGCIIVSIAEQLQNHQSSTVKLQYTASDISKEALTVAKANAKAYKAKIDFIQSDLFKGISGKFDIITANLPYVSVDDYKNFLWNLKYEPKVAITEGSNKWKLYELFFKEVKKHINPGATILMEFDPKTKPYAAKWIKQFLPGAKVKFYKDLHNLWRFIEIKIKE